MIDVFFFFNDTATTEIYTLSLHDALPISPKQRPAFAVHEVGAAEGRRPRSSAQLLLCMRWVQQRGGDPEAAPSFCTAKRSEEHTSELQSRETISYAVFCLKKKKYTKFNIPP